MDSGCNDMVDKLDTKAEFSAEQVIRSFCDTGHYLEAQFGRKSSQSPSSNDATEESHQSGLDDCKHHSLVCEEIKDAGFDYDIVAAMPEDILSIVHRTAIRRQNSRQNSGTVTNEKIQLPSSRSNSRPLALNSNDKGSDQWEKNTDNASDRNHIRPTEECCTNDGPQCSTGQSKFIPHDSAGSVMKADGNEVYYPKMKKMKSWDDVSINDMRLQSLESKIEDSPRNSPRKNKKRSILERIFVCGI